MCIIRVCGRNANEGNGRRDPGASWDRGQQKRSFPLVQGSFGSSEGLREQAPPSMEQRSRQRSEPCTGRGCRALGGDELTAKFGRAGVINKSPGMM